MAEPRYQHTLNGQEVQEADLNLLGKTGALMDDRVLAEVLRLAPYAGAAVTKAIVPYDFYAFNAAGASAGNRGTVVPSGSANGSVVINPFRAVLGSRTVLAVNAELDNWRDIRSSVFVNAGSGALSLTQALGANSSGNARIDLVYCAFAVDQNANSVTRKVKAPSGTTITATSVFQTLSQLLTIGVVAGTPNATPATPSLPADAAGTFYIALAYVRVPNGFTSGSTVATQDVISAAPIVPMQTALGGDAAAVASCNSRVNGVAFTAARVATWANSGTRPGYVVEPTFGGGRVTRLIALDLLDPASTANWSQANGTVIDDTIDWRNRVFQSFTQIEQGGTFAFDHASAIGTQTCPAATTGLVFGATQTVDGGQSFIADFNATVANACLAQYADPTKLTQLNAGTKVAVYTLTTDGKLYLYTTGFPKVKMFIWLTASPQFENF